MMGNLGCLRPGDVIASASDIDELLHYREMKEQGRLLVLPQNITLDMLVETLCNYQSGCPSNLGLKENCKSSCEQCWLAALKGAEE